MNITDITQENLRAFQTILPAHQKYQPTRMFGCVVDDTAVGTVAVNAAEEGYSLLWLWVAPEFRKKASAAPCSTRYAGWQRQSPDTL